MKAATLQRLVRQLRQTAGARNLDAAPEAELLERFQRDGDPEAFEAIARRYAGCVLSACRKVLSSGADVEDAFQATFLVLLQSANSIRRRQALGGWLAGVAHRVALKALSASVRRRRAERVKPAAAAQETSEMSWHEACAVLHEELDRLPDTYRLPLLLCYLEGKSRDEAAQQLGVKTDVVRGRLARGRDRLRERLLKRGVALSAGLLAVVANSVTAGGPPEHLVRATLTAATTGRTTATVAALVHGASPPMTLCKFKLLAVAALVAGLITAGVNVSMLGAPPSPPAPQEAKAPSQQPSPEKKAAEPAKDREKGPIDVSGQVLDPDGKPAAGAEVYLLGSKRTGAKPIATADKDGKFHFTAKPEDVGSDGRVLAVAADNTTDDGRVVGVATGHAPDWIDFARCAEGAVTLRLRKDDVPFTGRVVTLEGQPVAGATVEAERLGAPADGDLTAWLDNNVKLRKESYWVNERGLVTVTPSTFGKRLTATTDKDGKFRLTGAGRDRVLTVRVTGNGIEHKFFRAATRPDAPKEGYIKTGGMNHGLYGPEVTVLVGPSKPIVGTVTDRATGKPVAGVTVQETSHSVTTAVTDAKGQYRLEGVPKSAHYSVTAAGREGLPYFDTTQHAIIDTAGLDPLTVNFVMDRGLEVIGRAVDKDTGKPIPGDVHYDAARDNPNLKDFPSRGEPTVLISSWGKLRPDGTFTVLAIPGPGVMTLCVSGSDRYPRLNARQELTKLKVRSFPVDPAHAIVALDADPKKPASLVCNFEVAAGKTRKGTVLDPDGKPLEGVHTAGVMPGERAEALKSPEFRLAGLGGRKRILLFVHAEKKLGAVVVTAGDSEDPLTVKLQPLGAIEGQVLDADGKPWSGLKVTLRPAAPRRDEDHDNLPDELIAFQGMLAISPGLWSKFVGREATTDKDGRFRLEGVLPGVDFNVYVSEGDLAKRNTLVDMRKQVRVEPGKANDLGTLKKGAGEKEE
jgi:RNA polymerase sigma factor (sigma-70 family)